jgi:hypothetical protein
MAVNRGKDFEAQIRKGLEQHPDISVDRFPDPMAGYAGIRNICDFGVYMYPYQYYLECKAFSGNTLNFKGAITKDQWDGLQEKSQIKGVNAGVLVWFVSHDITVYVPIQELVKHKEKGNKSLNIKQLNELKLIVVPAIKRRVLFDYNMKWLLQTIGEDKWQETLQH